MPEKNRLYYGDNYDVLRLYVRDESVDLVYLDPPFNSRQDYSVLFAEKDGSKSSAQIHAFEGNCLGKRCAFPTFPPHDDGWQ